jgi:5'-deoxynucleotidase YfbR-like HD superfamily hydrolase
MIEALRKGFNVKRFHTTPRIQMETVGHHTCNVMAILNRLSPFCSRELLVAALYHDVDEAYTGDVPAPFKWDNPDAKKALAEGGDLYMKEHKIPVPELDEHEYRLLKLADMLDLVFSSIEELNKGNLYAKELITNGQQYILAMREENLFTDDVWEKVEEMIVEVKLWPQMTSK